MLFSERVVNICEMFHTVYCYDNEILKGGPYMKEKQTAVHLLFSSAA
jgi:hypothetical protein